MKTAIALRSFLPSLLMLATASWLTACTLRPPVSGEERMVDSSALAPELAQGAASPPFCLHLRYHNAYFVTMSDARTEAWVTEGACSTAGAKRTVDAIRIGWRNDWHDTQTNRQCVNTNVCSVNDTNVIVGQNIQCAVAQARHGNQVAFITTDQAVCH